MAHDFKTKAQRYEEMLMRKAEAAELGVGDGPAPTPTANGANDLPVQWQQAIAEVTP